MSEIEARLAELGHTLPSPPPPAGNYLPASRSGNVTWLAGVGSSRADGSRILGKLGADLTTQQGYEAARCCALNLLSRMQAELGDLDRVTRVLKVVGFVNSAPDFTQQAQVVDGATKGIDGVDMVALFTWQEPRTDREVLVVRFRQLCAASVSFRWSAICCCGEKDLHQSSDPEDLYYDLPMLFPVVVVQFHHKYSLELAQRQPSVHYRNGLAAAQYQVLAVGMAVRALILVHIHGTYAEVVVTVA